jgi:uncharacterized protein (TIGR03437 family)
MMLRATLLRILVLGLVLAALAGADCKYDKVGPWYDRKDAFLNGDKDGDRTIKILGTKGLLDDRMVVQYDGHKYLIPYSGYTKAVRDCLGRTPVFPDWFDDKDNYPPLADQKVPVPIVTASSDVDGADFDGDGDSDVAQIQYFEGVTVWLGGSVGLGGSGGNFTQTGVVYPTGPGPETLIVADLDGDGQQDVLVADSGDFNLDPGKLAVLLGLRDGTFAAAVAYAAGVAPRSVAAGDFNGDGHPDVAVASTGSLGAPNLPPGPGSVAILLGKGDGSLLPATLLEAGERPMAIVAADFSGDHKLDLAVANNGSDSVSVFVGKGDGTFQAPVNLAVGSQPAFLGSADFNGDGRADLAVLHAETSTISMWMNNGQGDFVSAGRYISGSGVVSFEIADSPDDERPTILSPDLSNSRYLLLGVDRAGTLVAPPSYPVGANPQGIAAADFDGNQQLDLAVASDGGLAVILNPRPRQFPQPAPQAAVAGVVTRANSVAAGDFNGDGVIDLAATQGGVAVLDGNGDGTFGAPRALPGGGSGLFLTAADLNGDQRLDLIAVEDVRPSGNVAVYLAGAGGSFSRTAYPVGMSPRSVAAADFNGDQRPDLAVANFGDLTAPAGVSLLLATAGGGFGATTRLDAGFSINTVAAGDFNGDGRMDLAAAGQLTAAPSFLFGVRVMLGNGAGGFQALPDLETSYGPNSLSAEDFNGDGLLDLAIAHCCGQTDMSLLLGNGDGTFRSISFPGGASPAAVAAGDFDGDGALDLAVTGAPGGARSGTATILDFVLPAFDTVSAASGSPGVQAPDSILSAYGAKLATETAAAPSPNWPAELGGSRVQVRDADGVERDAGVAFASSGQINYHLPAETAYGRATVTITIADGRQVSSPVQVVRIAPGLFQATPEGLAAAWIIRVKPDGARVLEPVVQLSAANEVVAAPIDLSNSADVVVLQLYGTGVRRRFNLSDVHVVIGGVECAVLYAGDQTEFPGLDQINVQLPGSLRGAGLVTVVVTVEDRQANVLKIRIK